MDMVLERVGRYRFRCTDPSIPDEGVIRITSPNGSIIRSKYARVSVADNLFITVVEIKEEDQLYVPVFINEEEKLLRGNMTRKEGEW